MRNLFTKWEYLFLIIALICLIISIYFTSNSIILQNSEEKYQNSLINYQLEIEDLTNRTMWQIQSSGLKISNSLNLVSGMDSVEVNIADLDKRFPLLVLRYTELGCQMCVEEHLVFFKAFIDRLKEDDFLILSTYNNLRDLILFRRLNQIDYDIYNIESLKLPIEDANTPYLFVLQKDFTVSHLFMLDTDNLKQIEEYYNYIFSKYYAF